MHGFAYITSIENWIFEKTKFNQFHPNVSNYVIACSIIAEITQFHLIPWCGNFVKTQIPYNFSKNCAFPQNFHTRKLCETTVFYAVHFAAFLQKTREHWNK